MQPPGKVTRQPDKACQVMPLRRHNPTYPQIADEFYKCAGQSEKAACSHFRLSVARNPSCFQRLAPLSMGALHDNRFSILSCWRLQRAVPVV